MTLVPEIVVPIILTGPWCSRIEATSNDWPNAVPSYSATAIRVHRNIWSIHAVHAEFGDLLGVKIAHTCVLQPLKIHTVHSVHTQLGKFFRREIVS